MMTHEVSRSPVAGATITIFLTVMVLGLGVLTSGIAMAGPPNAANSTFPSLINILDPTGGVPDPDGSFVIIVRDASNTPLPGVTVFVDFSGAPDVSLSNAQPGATLVSCVPPVVSAVTDNNGVASFNIVGAVASQTNNWSPTSTASIRAGSTPLGTTQVKAFDLDGVDGMTVNDLHFMFGPFGQPQPFAPIMDYDGNGFIGINDLSLMTAKLIGRRATDPVIWCGSGPTSSATTTTAHLDLWKEECATSGVTFDLCTGPSAHTDFRVAVTLPGGLTGVTGIEATIEINSGTNPFPNYYRYDEHGCHWGGLSVLGPSGSGPLDPQNCLDSSPMYSNPQGNTLYQDVAGSSAFYPETVTGATNVEEIRLRTSFSASGHPGCFSSSSGGAPCCWGYGQVPAATKTTVLAFRITHNNFSCSGCNTPVSYILKSVRLLTVQPGDWAYHDPPPACPVPQTSPHGAGAAMISHARILASAASIPSSLVISPDASGSNVVGVNGGAVGVSPTSSGVWLSPASPNPSRGEVSLTFNLPRAGLARVVIVDISGRIVRTLEDGELAAGPHRIVWNELSETGTSVRAGVYFCRLLTDADVLTSTIVLRH